MDFRTKQNGNVVGNGAIVLMDDTEVKLVDVLIHLHRGAHGEKERKPIDDVNRADLLRTALLHVGRSLSGWSDDVLAVRLATSEPEELAQHAHEFVRRPKLKPLSLPPAPAEQTPAHVGWHLGQVTMMLLALDPAAIRAAAGMEITRPEYRAAFLSLADVADVADQLRALLLGPDAPISVPGS